MVALKHAMRQEKQHLHVLLGNALIKIQPCEWQMIWQMVQCL